MFGRKVSTKEKPVAKLQKFYIKSNKYGDERKNWSSFRLFTKGKEPSSVKINAGTKPRWEPPVEKDLQTWTKVDREVSNTFNSPDKMQIKYKPVMALKSEINFRNR